MIAEVAIRLYCITLPVWLPVYLAWQREWKALLASVVWMPVLFLVGVPLHTGMIAWRVWGKVMKRHGHTIIAAAALILLALGCGKEDEHRPNGGQGDDWLAIKGARIAELLPTVRDEDGFIEFDKCDSVHWSALAGSVLGPINIRAVIDGKGKLHRRPPRYPECYPEHSKSENSRDAFLMVLVYALMHDDLELVHDIFKYGRAHNWVMGKGPLSRTFFTPNMQALYAQAVEHLGGPSYLERLQPIAWASDLSGFEAHLQAVSVLAYSKIHGYITEKGFEVLERAWQRQPRNPLFAAAYYRFSGVEAARSDAVRSLADEGLWPANRLPTSADRCEPWLVQRDSESASWQPCPEEGRTHSGGDYLFVHAVLSGRF